MKRQDYLSVDADAGGTCVATGRGVMGHVGTESQRGRRVRAEVRPRVHPLAPKQAAEDVAPWVMRFLALALVLFVLVLLVFHG